ncbi:hypothetical protein Sp245p_09685 [Azospirillum baldaniorum]|uniref:Uncharacterized protein n=1 Tax=Azospirillum baldaniorum TaxID=1064539 RepID=A0A9P1JQN4_9PROT|nr:hypothetical protein [Azospirillum baldaniorum]AWJ90037.1 hypothetical protein Sp245p_09685 [Azospirillum baldaniorum]TWA67486.1 hypothetical protein FBZ84_10592 [Azospirillum baldaniorum]TWA77424.1 hypothetical protein FBZ85_107299 [Azospirillum brasilense]CCC97923.1 conserved exported protein of unknown function [Azospirillum baldaniorum]
MPNIAFNFAQPGGSNACGAYALTAALTALPSVASANYPITLCHSTPRTRMLTPPVTINGSEAGHALAGKIYKITGDLDIAGSLGSMSVAYEDGPDLQNSPSALAYVAKQFGLTVTVNIIKDANTKASTCQTMASLLLQDFDDEVRRCMLSATVNGEGGNGVLNGVDYAAPGSDEVHLLCVAQGKSMHWLTRGTNGFYDPGDATINAWTIAADGTMTGGGYTFTGIWIVLK